MSLDSHRVENVTVAGAGGHLEADLGLVSRGAIFLLHPVDNSQAVGFSTMFVRNKACIIRCSIRSRHVRPVPGLQAAHVPGTH